MPTYQYLCKRCNYQFEELQSIKEPALVRCPQCNTDSLVRVMGSGSGVIFKGSGFYLTDYKKKESTKAEQPTTKKEETKEEKKETKTEQKSDTKSSSKKP